MLVIRLSRTGKKHQPNYRLVVADKKRAVKGKYLDVVGHYNPVSQPKQFTANKEKVLAYLKNGAQLSVTALNLLCDNGVLPKNRKIKIVHARKKAVPESHPERVDKSKDLPDKKDKVADDNVEESKDSEIQTEEPAKTPTKSAEESEKAASPDESKSDTTNSTDTVAA